MPNHSRTKWSFYVLQDSEGPTRRSLGSFNWAWLTVETSIKSSRSEQNALILRSFSTEHFSVSCDVSDVRVHEGNMLAGRCRTLKNLAWWSPDFIRRIK